MTRARSKILIASPEELGGPEVVTCVLPDFAFLKHRTLLKHSSERPLLWHFHVSLLLSGSGSVNQNRKGQVPSGARLAAWRGGRRLPGWSGHSGVRCCRFSLLVPFRVGCTEPAAGVKVASASPIPAAGRPRCALVPRTCPQPPRDLPARGAGAGLILAEFEVLGSCPSRLKFRK